MRKAFYTLLLCCSWLGASAQNASEQNLRIYREAEQNYVIGRLDAAQEQLTNKIGNFTGSVLESAYRLLALCCIGMDDDLQAEEYVRKLLAENPYYTATLDDPPRFIDMVERQKSGQTAKITTASSQAENLNEVPVPTTLITEEMIKTSGARNLKELLIAYVPGMTNVECNEEMNIAMRGIYSSGQEKILFMLNGHRLNSYATNVARPDFSISLEKIKQVEVLRGPASSLYGGVALTAVVNIITKNGIDINGLQVKGGVGNYGQWKGSAIYGTHYMDMDIAAWANIYNADGQKFYLPTSEQIGSVPVDGSIIIGGYNKKPSYDVGVTFSWKHWTFMHNSNFSKTVAPYSLSYFFAPYSYEQYRTLDGNKPGYANWAHHTNLSYNTNVGKWSLGASLIYDTEYQNRYLVATDTFPAYMNYILVPNGTQDSLLMTHAVFQSNSWHESNIGFLLKGGYSYELGKGHKGNINFGLQYNHFELEDSRNIEGNNFSQVIIEFDDSKNLFTGKEHSADAYVQLKHQWHDFIVNAGLRYDYKKRNNDITIQEWSPRIALIYSWKTLNAKLCYSKSFVDAPYYYRNNTLDTSSSGFDELMSEYLNSLQFTLSCSNPIPGLNVELNAFHNRASSLIFQNGLFYSNSGTMKNIGLELICDYKYKHKMETYLQVEWQKLTNSENYTSNDSYIYNIPNLSANLVASYNILRQLKIHTNINYTSKQQYEYLMFLEDDIIDEVRDVPSRVVFNLGADFTYKNLKVGANCYNLLNKNYAQGGPCIAPIRQQGRWFMFDVTFKI